MRQATGSGLVLALWLAAAGSIVVLHAQTAPTGRGGGREAGSTTIGAAPSGEVATVVFFNRPVAVLRRRCWDGVRGNAPRVPGTCSTIWRRGKSPAPSTGGRSTTAR